MNTVSESQVFTQAEGLARLRDVMQEIGATSDREAILNKLVQAMTRLLHFDRVLVLLVSEEFGILTFAAYSHTVPGIEGQFVLEQLQIDLNEPQQDLLLGRWVKGESVLVEDTVPYAGSRFDWVIGLLRMKLFYGVPLRIGERFRGVILADNSLEQAPITAEQRTLLDTLAAHMAITLENARLYQLTDEKLGARVRELEILSRIDRELNYTLSVERVLTLALDWALRFTNSHSAAFMMADVETRTLRFTVGYGYDRNTWDRLLGETWTFDQGITGRTARRVQAENVGDVTQDPDYVEIMPGTRSQLSVPVIRKDTLTAVITLENPVQNGYTNDNLEFVQRLAARAAIAIDNANLYTETLRERQKLELILCNIADVVIVIDSEDRLVLVNQAAVSALRLLPKEEYVGRRFTEVFQYSPLPGLYKRALAIQQGLVEEVELPDGRVFHASIVPEPQVGWSIVMHDITPFRETDKLKNELLATTSHDLKNPLSAIVGYVELIHMTNKLNTQGMEYINHVHTAVDHMKHLIDDLLDMARIESGITLRYNRIHLESLVRLVEEQFHPLLAEKAMSFEILIPPDLPPVPADEDRLKQILANLISNAIKYTPPEGHVKVKAEKLDSVAKIAVQDDGLGISPEDQAQVFARFYRVRSPETESIEGTGLGLAIVKSLVERHGGEIGLESYLGTGSTFYFTLPLTAPPDAVWENGVKRNGS